MSTKLYQEDESHKRSRETTKRKADRSYQSSRSPPPHKHRSPHHKYNSKKSSPLPYRSKKSSPLPYRSKKSSPLPYRSKKSPSNPRTSPPKDEKPIVKEKVNLGLSGKLAQDTNMQNGVIVKYSEPFEAAKPFKKWRLYPFKNDEALSFIEIHNKSHFLLGRDRKVVDIPLDHPSISKQHAAIQFRKIECERKDGSKGKEIRPYLMDLDSSNKTFLNNKTIDPMKYYQLLEKDVLKFGFSTREYVVLIDHEVAD